jgi:hypothetical protein
METHYVPATELTQLMLLWKQSLFIVRTIRNTQIHCASSPYLTGNTLRLRYGAQSVNAVWGNSRCLF